ncbi:tRNA ligase, partial [Perkinsus olseni]
AFCEVPSYDKLVDCLLSGADAAELSKACSVTPGIPVKPMLAKPTKSITEVLDRFKNIKFTAEYKYDGERAQVHLWTTEAGKREIRVYSRNSEDLTEKYPDVVDAIEEMISVIDKVSLPWQVIKIKILDRSNLLAVGGSKFLAAN